MVSYNRHTLLTIWDAFVACAHNYRSIMIAVQTVSIAEYDLAGVRVDYRSATLAGEM